MDERLLARLLFVAWALTFGALTWFDLRWSESGAAVRVAVVVAVVAAVVGLALDFKHHYQDRRARQGNAPAAP